MKIAVLISVLSVATSVFGALPFASERVNRKQVEAVCVLNGDNTITMHMGITFNGNSVDQILALPGPTFERYPTGGSNAVPCSYTGSLATSSGIAIESSVFANGGLQGSNTCGARPIYNGNTLLGYGWYIQVREKFNLAVYTDIDRTYHVQCFLQNALRNYVTTSVQVYEADDLTGNSTPIYPASTLSIDSLTNVVRLNEYVRLRVDTRQENNRSPAHPYGSYVYHCDNRFIPNINAQRTLFIGDNGCPTGNLFGLSNGFMFEQYYTAGNGVRTYQSQTPAFIMASQPPPGDYFYITCYVQYCTGTEGSDARCDTGLCAFNQGRKKRATVSTADADQVTLAIRFDYGNDTATAPGTGVNTGSEAKSNITMIAIIATVGAVLFMLMIVGICFVCYGLRRRADDDDDDDRSSTDDSRSNLPQHLNEAHLRPAKI